MNEKMDNTKNQMEEELDLLSSENHKLKSQLNVISTENELLQRKLLDEKLNQKNLDKELNELKEENELLNEKCQSDMNELMQSNRLNSRLRESNLDLKKELRVFKENYNHEKVKREMAEFEKNEVEERESKYKVQQIGLKKETKMLEDIVIERTKESMKLQEEKERLADSLSNVNTRLNSLRSLLLLKEKKVEELLSHQRVQYDQLEQNRDLKQMGLGLCKIIEDLRLDLNGMKSRNQNLVEILLRKI
jgi:chromosome segregation ATPase